MLKKARENGVPIVEANVGVTQIISKGEVVKTDRVAPCDNSTVKEIVTVGTIAIPAPPSPRNRDIQQRAFIKWRVEEMKRRYKSCGWDDKK